MAITTTCPGCSTKYQLADTMRGKKVRCKSCSETFTVRDRPIAPDRDENEEAIQSSPRPAKRVARYEDDEDTGRPLPRRRPRKKDSNATVLTLVIVGGVAAGVLVLGLGGFAIWAMKRARQLQPPPVVVNSNLPPAFNPQNQAGAPPAPENNAPPADQNPPPVAPPFNPPAQNPAPAQGPPAVELSNGKVSGFGTQMEVTVDYRFTSGSPGGKRLYLIIKATKAGGLRQSYYLAELKSIGNKTQGTIGARGMSFGAEHGPFEMWIGESSGGIGLVMTDRELKKISNVVTVATKQFSPPGMRPPIGPRRIRP
jgi:predicted Zn finger-like uncharacterized protein